MLSPYRVIDLTDETGLLAGQMLADLGADVVQVEPPGGSSARRVAPFHKDEPGDERSLFWWAYARNKRSIAIDLDSEAGREEFAGLLAGADVLIESEPAGRLEALGFGADALRERHPALVHVSISPFGRTGPKADWVASDLTVAAASGLAHLSGEATMPPVRACVPQMHAHAGADAAVAALIALADRRRSGLGQHVDVSAQQSATLATMFRSLDGPLAEAPATRTSGGIQVGAHFLRTRFPVRDGWVVLGPAVLPSTGHFMQRLLAWAHEEGFGDPERIEIDWGITARRLLSGEWSFDDYAPTEETLEAFFATRTKEELMRVAVSRRLLLAPLLGVDEIADSEQLVSREAIVTLEQGDAGAVRFPGPFAKFGAEPIRYRRPAPRLDEHGDAIRAEAPREVATGDAAGDADALPLEGVKILDLFWVLAGPGSTRMLADYGATVVKVESSRRIDTLRVIPPYQFNNPHPEGAGGFQSANANKLDLALDVGSEEGQAILRELVEWADVVTESFAPGVMEQIGLDYESLRAIKPDVIMISSCLMGQGGPWRDFTGFGNLAASVTGFQPLASWPDRPPSGPYGAYTDFIAVRYNAACILAALDHRARTGQGQYIDQSQAEAALHFLAPAFLDYTVNGRVPEPCGNHDPQHFPHDVYPAKPDEEGEPRWVAIVCRDDAEWRGLCEAIERPDLVAQRNDRAAVDAALRAFTAERDVADLEALLQQHHVPSHRVATTMDLAADPQLLEREHYIEIPHSIYQTTTVESSRLRMSRSQPKTPPRALDVGCDNRAVLEGILGWSPERIADLAERGVLL